MSEEDEPETDGMASETDCRLAELKLTVERLRTHVYTLTAALVIAMAACWGALSITGELSRTAAEQQNMLDRQTLQINALTHLVEEKLP